MTLNNTLVFTLIYAIVGILEITGEMLRETGQNVALVYTTKPLLMPILISWILVNSKNLKYKFQKIILISLVFSMAGDVFLMFRNDDLFVFGLVSFLLAHVFYIIGFASNIKQAYKQLASGQKLLFSIPFTFYVGLFLYVLKDYMLENPTTKDLFVPVVVYALVIGTMGVLASWRVSCTGKISFYMVLSGALLFIASDSLIAINKFVQSIPYASLLIMSTYIVAQYLIVRGIMIHTSPVR